MGLGKLTQLQDRGLPIELRVVCAGSTCDLCEAWYHGGRGPGGGSHPLRASPQEMGCGSGATFWRWLRDSQRRLFRSKLGARLMISTPQMQTPSLDRPI